MEKNEERKIQTELRLPEKAEEIARAMERLTPEQQEYAAAHLLGVVQGMILSGTMQDEKKTA